MNQVKSSARICLPPDPVLSYPELFAAMQRLRTREIEKMVDALIDLVDNRCGDPDLEPDQDFEPDAIEPEVFKSKSDRRLWFKLGRISNYTLLHSRRNHPGPDHGPFWPVKQLAGVGACVDLGRRKLGDDDVSSASIRAKMPRSCASHLELCFSTTRTCSTRSSRTAGATTPTDAALVRNLVAMWSIALTRLTASPTTDPRDHAPVQFSLSPTGLAEGTRL